MTITSEEMDLVALLRTDGSRLMPKLAANGGPPDPLRWMRPARHAFDAYRAAAESADSTNPDPLRVAAPLRTEAARVQAAGPLHPEGRSESGPRELGGNGWRALVCEGRNEGDGAFLTVYMFRLS